MPRPCLHRGVSPTLFLSNPEHGPALYSMLTMPSVRTEPSKAVEAPLPRTSSAPRPTRGQSMPACGRWTGLASRAASGTEAGSRSRPSRASCGRSRDGRRRRSPGPRTRPAGRPPRRRAATRRTRRTPARLRARRATTAGTSRCGAPRASQPTTRRRRLRSPLRDRFQFVLQFQRCFLIHRLLGFGGCLSALKQVDSRCTMGNGKAGLGHCRLRGLIGEHPAGMVFRSSRDGIQGLLWRCTIQDNN